MADIIPFRFTVMADIHDHVYPQTMFPAPGDYTKIYEYFFNACDEVNNLLGSPGDFLLTTGDVSDSYPNTRGGTSPERVRDVIDEKFGYDFRWTTAVGNHDITDTGGLGVEWIKQEWSGGNPSAQYRESTSDYAYAGPDGCSETQFYYFHKGIMFIVMNWYWDGTTSPTADVDGLYAEVDGQRFYGGRIVDEQLAWLSEIFETYSGYHKIICGHGNAFAFGTRHDDYTGLGGADKDNRDTFWRMLEDNKVIAYINGHTHERRIDYVDNTYWNGGEVEDSWSYGKSNVPQICSGQIDNKWPSGAWYATDSYPTFMDVEVSETSVKFDIYEATTVDGHIAEPGWQLVLTETVPLVDKDNSGGVWYYKQDKFGSEWFNKVSNNKGWTVDFNLRVSDVQNSKMIVDESNKGKGVGVYVNDGTRQESINFLNQEIVFSNAKQSISYDLTTENDYRITGKKNNLKLFAKPSRSSSYSEIANVNFSQEATPNGNAFNPSVFEDISGDSHAVWWDDGGGVGSIFYSKFESGSWSIPEKIVSLDNGVQHPSILVNSNGVIYVVFESKQTEGSVVGLVYKNNIGWSQPYYTGQDIGNCKNVSLTFSRQSDLCVVWEDDRQELPEIYLDIFLKNDLRWKGERKLSNNSYGSYNPSISSYIDNLYISWTRKDIDNTSSIEIIKYNAINSSVSTPTTVSSSSGMADFSDVLANVVGNIMVVWHDNLSGVYQIYAAVLNSDFDFLTAASAIVDGNDGARYPVLSEQLTTGNIYIAWQDFKDSSHESISVQDIRPSNSAIFVSYYSNGQFYSSGAGNPSEGSDIDVMMSFKDERNAYFPSLPPFFRGELPIVYESYLSNSDEYSFIGSNDMLLKSKSLLYTLSRVSSIFDVNYGISGDVSVGDDDRDFDLNVSMSPKEIRFGDFSNTLNAHYIFKDFKYYLDDAVTPYYIKNIDANSVDIDSISAFDAKVNNYGDVWIAGPCGIYYFVDRYNRLFKVSEDGLITDDTDFDKLSNFKAIAFDNYNNMYLGGNGEIKYSTDHVNGFKTLSMTPDISGHVSSIVFDKDNTMFVGTDSGLYVYDKVGSNSGSISSDYSQLKTITAEKTSLYSSFNNLTSENITSLKIDANNCLWIGTKDNGIYRFYKDNLLHFTTTHGLSSNIVNDIAIRNTAVRYIATANGVVKMVGFNFDQTISSKDDAIWNNNVKSVEWKDPNVLLAGTMSRINQVIINDDDNTYNTVFYEPGSAFNNSVDDFNVYYLTDTVSISDSDVLEVYVNGNLVHFGYDVSSDKKTIRFLSPLSNSDVVEIIVRRDLKEIYTFNKENDERSIIGSSLVGISFLEDIGGDLYAVSVGDENEVKVNDSNSSLPFDKVHLDTLPPDFIEGADGITIESQLDSSLVKVRIDGATDTFDSIAGSGIEGMIISNYDNFTTDGSTPQEYVPFSNYVTHDLGVSLENVITELSFASGEGSVVYYTTDGSNELYAATSKPSVVYKYSWTAEEWQVLYSYDSDQYVDFIVLYNDKLLISVGHDTDISNIYIYESSSSGRVFSRKLPVTESRSYCSYVLDGKLYIGAGIGLGDEYSEGAGNGGVLYLFDDGTAQNVVPSLTPIVENIDENIYAITSVGGSNNLLLATGPEGYIYEVDVENQAAFIVYNGAESLVSLSFLDVSGQSMVFAGGETKGIIRKTVFGNNTYDITFRTTPSKISVLKVFDVVDPLGNSATYSSVYAAVGNVVYYLSDVGTWTWRYTHSEVINDITLKSDTNALYVISDSGITRIKPLTDSKIIYLKLIDRAGNESTLEPIPVLNNNGEIDSPWATAISISNLKDFINENKIFEIDEIGNTLYTLKGDNKFYSADKIESESGEYVSEIFDASNDLVKWESISWEATELTGTTVSVYVRSSTSNNDILTADWVGPFDNSQAAGVNISSMMGQFMQFKAVLNSTVKGVTPSFYRASIRAITSESVHFFTTNFTMPSKINKGILTSQKVVPVSSEIVFGINTTNSIDWNEYQPIDENRIFNVNQTGHNLRVGIKFISPNRSLIEPAAYDEYGPYNSNLYVNTIDIDFTNSSGLTRGYHFKVSLYSDAGMTNEVFSAYSSDSPDGFSADGIAIPSGGVELTHGSSTNILFSVPGTANVTCDTYYFVKIESIYDTEFELFSDDTSFVSSCTSSFIDNIDFDFTNNESGSNYYHFRIKFYTDLERTNEYLTVFSGNNRSGWFVDDIQISEEGTFMAPGSTVNVVYRPTFSDFDTGSIYYLTIEAHDGTDYVFASNSYTFQTRDIQSTEYCGGYMDVPIVNNFGIMFELDNNEFVTLNM